VFKSEERDRVALLDGGADPFAVSPPRRHRRMFGRLENSWEIFSATLGLW